MTHYILGFFRPYATPTTQWGFRHCVVAMSASAMQWGLRHCVVALVAPTYLVDLRRNRSGNGDTGFAVYADANLTHRRNPHIVAHPICQEGAIIYNRNETIITGRIGNQANIG